MSARRRAAAARRADQGNAGTDCHAAWGHVPWRRRLFIAAEGERPSSYPDYPARNGAPEEDRAAPNPRGFGIRPPAAECRAEGRQEQRILRLGHSPVMA